MNIMKPLTLYSVCWLYTKKRSANFGIPLNGWYQSNAGGWELIEDVKISMRDQESNLSGHKS